MYSADSDPKCRTGDSGARVVRCRGSPTASVIPPLPRSQHHRIPADDRKAAPAQISPVALAPHKRPVGIEDGPGMATEVECRDPSLHDLHIVDPAEFPGSVAFAANHLDEAAVRSKKSKVRSCKEQVSEVPVPCSPRPIRLNHARTIAGPEPDHLLQEESALVTDLDIGQVNNRLSRQPMTATV